jgi:hypothetical protein
MGDMSQVNELRGCQSFSADLTPAKYIIPNHFMAQCTNSTIDVELFHELSKNWIVYYFLLPCPISLIIL